MVLPSWLQVANAAQLESPLRAMMPYCWPAEASGPWPTDWVGVGPSRLYQASFAGCLLSVLQGSISFCWAVVVTILRLPACQKALEKVGAPAHGLFSAERPPSVR